MLWWFSGIASHLSAFWKLKEESEVELLAGLPSVLKDKLGLHKGLLLNFVFWTIIISPLMVYILPTAGNTKLAYLITGILLGGSFKQLISSYKEKN